MTPTGSGTAIAGPLSNQVTVVLSGIPNAQHLTATLNGIQDAASPSTILNNMAAHMDVLVGDTNGDGFVNSADIGQTKSQSKSTGRQQQLPRRRECGWVLK